MLVELENTELLIEKLVFVDGGLVAVERVFNGCTICGPTGCPDPI